MKKTTYSCDLCGRTLDPEDLKGIHWQGPDATIMKAVHAHNAETHLCRACIKQIKESDWQHANHPGGCHEPTA